MASAITALVCIWLLSGLAMQMWLARRQDQFLAANRGRVPAAFAASVSADDYAHASDYACARLYLRVLDSGWLLLLALFWTLGGGLAGLAVWLPSGWLGGVALLALFAASHELLRTPPRVLQVFGVEARFGFNRAGPGLFLRDVAMRAALAAVLAALAGGLLLVPVLAFAAAAAWPLAAALAVAGGGALIWAQPRLIAPLFNRFRPLEPGPLRRRLEAMIARCGAHAETMFVMDGSRRSGLANAYFAGFGRAKRVVLFDTLINELDDAEIEAVLAHELGHDRKGHIRRHYARMAALLALGILGLGAAGEADVLAVLGVPAHAGAWLAAGYLLLPLLAWPLQPWLAAHLRRYEYEADAFAVAHADAGALISALKKILARNAAALAADPLYTAFNSSHPPPEQRLAVLETLAAEGYKL